VIVKRLKEYHAKTAAVESYYDAFGKVERIKGDGNIEETFRMLSREIDKYLMPA
jgi:adenylate kinase